MKYQYYILIYIVDNRLSIDLNGKIIYDSGISYETREFDPPHEERIDHLLFPEKENALTFNFYNGSVSAVQYDKPNQYSFSYRIVKRITDPSGGSTEQDMVPPYVVTSESKPNITLPSKTYLVKPMEKEFRFELKKL